MGSLNDYIGELTDDVFLSTDYFAEPVIFYKGEDAASGVDVNVVWDADALPGTNEVEGDGVVLERRSGRRIRESITIECPISLDVDDRSDPPDRFVRGSSEVALVKRIMARDPAGGGMQLVRCIVIKEDQNRGRHRLG